MATVVGGVATWAMGCGRPASRQEAGGLVWLDEARVAWWEYQRTPGNDKRSGCRLRVLDAGSGDVADGGDLAHPWAVPSAPPHGLAYSAPENAFYVGWRDNVVRLAEGAWLADRLELHPQYGQTREVVCADGDGSVYMNAFADPAPSLVPPVGSRGTGPLGVVCLSPRERGATWTFGAGDPQECLLALYRDEEGLLALIDRRDRTGRLSVRRGGQGGGAESLADTADGALGPDTTWEARFTDRHHVAVTARQARDTLALRIWDWSTDTWTTSQPVRLGETGTMAISPDANRIAAWREPPPRPGSVPTVVSVVWR